MSQETVETIHAFNRGDGFSGRLAPRGYDAHMTRKSASSTEEGPHDP